MSCPSEDTSNNWPTWETRLTWGRKNYQRHPELTWLIQKYLTMTANLTALAQMIEEEGMEQLVTPSQVKYWRELYEAYRNRD